MSGIGKFAGFHGAIATLLFIFLAIAACGAPSFSPNESGSAPSDAGESDADPSQPSSAETPASAPSATAPQTGTSSSGASSSPEAGAESETAIAPSSDDSLWARLQQADQRYFVLMRHAIAPGTGDPANFQLADCSTQRNLSEAGRDQARRTGDAFQQRGIMIDQVLSSQWCRCLETAELMDVGDVEPFPPLNSFFRDRSSGPEQTAQVRAFMTEQDNPGVTLMVTHFVNISALSGSGVSSGEMVVMQVNDQEELEVVGELEPF